MAEIVDSNEQYRESGGAARNSSIMRKVVADIHRLPPCQIHTYEAKS